MTIAWALRQRSHNGDPIILDAPVGRGHVLLLGPDVTQRGEPYAAFKYLYNGMLAHRERVAARLIL